MGSGRGFIPVVRGLRATALPVAESECKGDAGGVSRHPRFFMRCIKPFKGVFPCGQCIACRKNRVMDWSVRLLHETGNFERSSFITLTYSDINCPLGGTLVKRDLQLFVKRLRKELEPRKIKYLACGEYGDQTHRPHYHLIVLGLGMSDTDALRQCWTFGFIDHKPLTFGRIKYVCGYVMKKSLGKNSKEVYGDRLPPFQVQSKGMGLDFALANSDRLIADLGFTVNGVNKGLPRYYRKVLKVQLPIEASFAGLAMERLDEEVTRIAAERGLEEWEVRARLRDYNLQQSRELQSRINMTNRKN